MPKIFYTNSLIYSWWWDDIIGNLPLGHNALFSVVKNDWGGLAMGLWGSLTAQGEPYTSPNPGKPAWLGQLHYTEIGTWHAGHLFLSEFQSHHSLFSWNIDPEQDRNRWSWLAEWRLRTADFNYPWIWEDTMRISAIPMSSANDVFWVDGLWPKFFMVSYGCWKARGGREEPWFMELGWLYTVQIECRNAMSHCQNTYQCNSSV